MLVILFDSDWNALSFGLQYPNYDKRKDQANLLHFNNLYNSTYVAKYFYKLTANAKVVVESITNATIKQFVASSPNEFQTLDKPFLLLALIGFVFHAVQDFWTHSNYITTQQRPAQYGGEVISSGADGAYNSLQCDYPIATYNFTEGLENWEVHTYVYPESELYLILLIIRSVIACNNVKLIDSA